MSNFGGYGQEAFGDPFGAGGPLHINRATAVKGHVVRVVFSEEPNHRSSSGRYDALNPANYVVAVVTGEVYGGAIFVTGVSQDVIFPPAYGPVGTGECGVDVYVDRPFVLGMTYRVEVYNVQAYIGGGGMGAPIGGNFVGVVNKAVAAKQRNRPGNVDFYNDPVTGVWRFDSGDLSAVGGELSLRKRVLRRCVTPRGAYAHLPTYGVGVRLKDVAGPSELQVLKSELTQQIKQEPDVLDADVITSLNQAGLLEVIISIKAVSGVLPPITISRTSGGSISFS